MPDFLLATWMQMWSKVKVLCTQSSSSSLEAIANFVKYEVYQKDQSDAQKTKQGLSACGSETRQVTAQPPTATTHDNGHSHVPPPRPRRQPAAMRLSPWSGIKHINNQPMQ